jgi:hypothetical protein
MWSGIACDKLSHPIKHQVLSHNSDSIVEKISINFLMFSAVSKLELQIPVFLSNCLSRSIN